MDSEDPGSASGIEFLEPQTANEDEEDIGGLAAIEETSFPIVSRNALHPELVKKHGIAVVVPPVQRRSEYKVYHGLAVSEILEEVEDVDTGDIYYIIIFEDGHEEEISFHQLVELEDGPLAIQNFNHEESASDDLVHVSLTRQSRNSGKNNHIAISSGDELSTLEPAKPVTRSRRSGTPRLRNSQSQLSLLSMNSESSSDVSTRWRKKRTSTRVRDARSARAVAQKRVNYSDAIALNDDESNDSSDSSPRLRKRKRKSSSNSRFTIRKLLHGPREPSPEGTRRSGRTVKHYGHMRELGEDEIPEKGTTNGAPKFTGAKEHFKKLSSSDNFRLRHASICDTCFESGDNEEKGRLVYCQGCTLSYHQKCLGSRTSRDHLVTKVGDKDFVLQCRRCIGVSRQKNLLAPDQGICFLCHDTGSACTAFRDRKTTKQEQKEREENDGEDPVYEFSPNLINNARNVLYRCMNCYRACHLHELPPKDGVPKQDLSEEEMADQRFSEYCRDWNCKECSDMPAEVETIVAWRPINLNSYEAGASTDMIEEDAKEYLVKFKKLSYSNVKWMPGAWVWGVTAATMRKAFAKRDNGNNLPKMTTEDAIPEESLRIDIVLAIEYTNVVKLHDEKVDKARIKEVQKAYVKFKGLGYEDVVWTEPPHPEDTERWADFKAAYEDWVMSSHIQPPDSRTMNGQIAKLRAQNFEKKVRLDAQPESLTGGKLMDYQLDGLNWLYYQWYRQQNAILADEMGLGKTIQIIGFLATLKEHSCWPFLIVVPNSTCANWRREIKQWASSLRVVTYFGSSAARKLSYKHELFPGGDKKLRCHVVVTSYDAAQDEDFRKVFRGVNWAGLVVDEGQRLKNDKNILYGALNALKAPFKVLLTGTPLQNNPRELFNLLQFLDASKNAQDLEVEYAELTRENVPKLHDMLRPFFLRRIKAEVLTFLPSMAQIIIPLTMTSVQKKLYKSILAKNPELIKAILSKKLSLNKNERASLGNILMQLRKCLCHPFVYSRDVEERTSNPAVSHRNLVDASSKLQLLEIMLPKLQERGHRVLIFSQFLDMLDMVEDFLDGMGFFYQRLDGTLSSLQKQKRIDEFNAPNSSLFAFLLSTRAGGVGINLATADTVIILDPDFNPHQDIQALSRAHRIGQKKKVLVFQLTTRFTAEEKIMQVGKKKMALDHVLIESMDADENTGMDLESILRHGTEALFNDDESQDIRYDSASVDRLLDRSQIEDTQPGKIPSAESQFSFAKVWANDTGALEGMEDSSEHEPDPSIWDKILRERERVAAEEAVAKAEVFGRGRRKRQTVDYKKQIDQGPVDGLSPLKARKFGGRPSEESDSDTDFQARGEESDVDSVVEGEPDEDVAQELGSPPNHASRLIHASQASPVHNKAHAFRRPDRPPVPLARSELSMTARGVVQAEGASSPCVACNKMHPVGYCPLKTNGLEFCNLCGLPHYGYGRSCPHVTSVTQLRAMVDALKHSHEPIEIKENAKKKIVGIIGDLNKRRRRKKEALERKDAQVLQPSVTPGQNHDFSSYRADSNNLSPEYYMNGVAAGKENSTSGPFTGLPFAGQ